MHSMLERAHSTRGIGARLVPLQAHGSRLPFFCTHGILPTLDYLRRLAECLGTEQPFYALQVHGLDGKSEPYRRVEDMAAQYVRDIRTVQSRGPYLLAGFSFGGLVAFEMAQQLHAQGQEIGLVALIDTYFPSMPKYLPLRTRFGSRVYPIVGGVERNLIDWSRLGSKRYAQQWGVYLRDGVKRRIARRAKKLSSRFALDTWDLSGAVRRVVDASYEAERAYVPQVYPGRVVLVVASEITIECQDTRLAWDDVAGGGLDVHVVPGGHQTLRHGTPMEILAAKLNVRVDRALASTF